MSERPVARVLPESRLPQLDRVFDYAIPEGMAVMPGVRVKVPLGRGGRLVTGIVLELASSSDFSGALAPIDQLVSPVPVLTDEVRRSAQAVANRQAGGLADVLRGALPPRAVRVEKQWLNREPGTYPRYQLDSGTEQAMTQAGLPTFAPGTRDWWQLRYGVEDVAGRSVPRAHFDMARLALGYLAAGQSCVLSVPDWRDRDLLEWVLREHVESDYLARFDSEDTPSERYRNFLRTLEPEPVIVFGARSAIWAPAHNLGALLVGFDKDPLHEEPLAPYAHTRDIALIRGEHTGAAVIFASFTPSLEILRLEQMDYLQALRTPARERPRVHATALTRGADSWAPPARLPSLAFHALQEALGSGPVLVQVFRSGYAPGLACQECSEPARCRTCGGPLQRQGTQGPIRCGWCRHIEPSWKCPECQSRALRPSGHGIGRTSQELGKAFPGIPVVRADGDHRVDRVGAQPALVIATRGAEPVADGGYRALLLLDGDRMLQRPSLDALEDTLLAWESALALLSPGAEAYLTDLTGPVATAMASDSLEVLLLRELGQRRSLRMPPAIRVASVEGPLAVVEQLCEELCINHPDVDQLGFRATSETTRRALLRMSYKAAPAIASELRARVIAHALPGSRGGALRVHMDARRALDELAESAQ